VTFGFFDHEFCFRELALEHGIKHWTRAPALNVDDEYVFRIYIFFRKLWKLTFRRRFISDVSEMIVQSLQVRRKNI
jgi:hypothetical protein